MTDFKKWYEDETFWETWGPLMFSKRRIANTGSEIDQILALAKISPPARVLDLCCGTGRHSLEFARRGFEVTGVDRTPAYLSQAEEQACKEGLGIEFIQCDMRDFSSPDSFDLAVNLFTSFGYFENQDDDRKVIENLFSSLKPGGIVVMDMASREINARVFRERDWSEAEGVFWLEERKIINNWSGIQNRWIMFKDNRRYEDTFSVRLYSALELTTLLRSAGFARTEVYGGYDGSPYDNLAKRLVALGHKD